LRRLPPAFGPRASTSALRAFLDQLWVNIRLVKLDELSEVPARLERLADLIVLNDGQRHLTRRSRARRSLPSVLFRRSCKESMHPRQMSRPRTFDDSRRQ
jgi:hypothetical protein